MSETSNLDQMPSEGNAEERLMNRRDLLKAALVVVGNAAIAGSAVSLLAPSEAQAAPDLVISPGKYGGYPRMINQLRLQFGRRGDYQEGFIQAAHRSNRVSEIPAGRYGMLPEDIGVSTIIPNSEFNVETTGFLHATQEVKGPTSLPLKLRWQKAEGELHDRIKEIIQEKYGEYRFERGVFSDIRMPVVTLRNIGQNRLEMFVRIPLPQSEEYMRRATGRWNDYDDQSKLRHDVPFDTLYDPGRSVYENLKVIYKDQFDALRAASRKTKIATAKMIQFYNNRARGTRFELTRAQKNKLNDLLGVRGTPNEIS